MSKLLKSEILSSEKECPALINRNSEYHLSGDLEEYFVCAISGKECLGKVISDDDDQSSDFFSRAHATINIKKIKRCPLYGTTFDLPELIKQRKAKEADNLIKKL